MYETAPLLYIQPVSVSLRAPQGTQSASLHDHPTSEKLHKHGPVRRLPTSSVIASREAAWQSASPEFGECHCPQGNSMRGLRIAASLRSSQ